MIHRAHIVIRGAVQGVGFRPFVYRLAAELNLPGWVSNSSEGVFIEVEGEKETLDRFLLRLEADRPPRSFIQSLECSYLDPAGFSGFGIRASSAGSVHTTLVLPDIATCPACLDDILDPSNRRFEYPFTNCTNCGPRFSIIESLPYDRCNTTMKAFEMCPACRREYEDPADRRFHAQPNACADCGPKLQLWSEDGEPLAECRDALLEAATAVREGLILALKGLGGFHLMVDARSGAAVERLRARKRREEKPLALMYPKIEAVREHCRVSPLEERLLLSPESPIVLLRRSGTGDGSPAASVAPANPCLGVMLPYTPLHHLLLRELAFPVVATSGNLTDETICTDEHEALRRLHGIADLFLVHNRPIARHMDDSIVRLAMGRELVLRRARGYAPLPLPLPQESPPILAAGAHLKNTVALAVGRNVFTSQHIGDLETAEATEAFQKVITGLKGLFRIHPVLVVADLHPDYHSTKYARSLGLPVEQVQHHYAHIAACMAENGLDEPLLGVSWDGTGYGPDGTIWGGEFLAVEDGAFHRAATFRRFRLPGNEQAIKEPRRAALGVLYEIWGESLFRQRDLPPLRVFSTRETEVLHAMLARQVNAPWTSSAGRLFDAVASIAGLCQNAAFEGQAAMGLEFAVAEGEDDPGYPFLVRAEGAGAGEPGLLIADWEPAIRELLDDLRKGVPAGSVAGRFHRMLAEVIVAVARRCGRERVALSGGCFQNMVLLERAVRRLEAEGFRPYWHQRIPPNDGGIAPGQIAAALRSAKKGGFRCV